MDTIARFCAKTLIHKHKDIGNREIRSVWSEIEVSKPYGFRNIARPITCVYVDGGVEYAEEMAKKST